MTLLLSTTIPGKPVGKGRPRAYGGRLVTPKTTREYERTVARMVPALGIAESCRVTVVALFARPRSRPDTVDAAVWASGDRVPRVGTPDVDNVVKAVLDGMQMGGALEDDRWVVELRASKSYAAAGESPCVVVTVERV